MDYSDVTIVNNLFNGPFYWQEEKICFNTLKEDGINECLLIDSKILTGFLATVTYIGYLRSLNSKTKERNNHWFDWIGWSRKKHAH